MSIRDFLKRAQRALAPLAAKLGKGGRGRAGSNVDSGFPGFAPVPGPMERLKAFLDSWTHKLRNNTCLLLAGAGGLLALSLCGLALAIAFRPPKPMAAPSMPISGLRDLLSRIPVPRVDPLAEESALDRPRKDRYTEAEIARYWLDLGLLPMDELREKNRTDLQTLFSAMEKP